MIWFQLEYRFSFFLNATKQMWSVLLLFFFYPHFSHVKLRATGKKYVVDASEQVNLNENVIEIGVQCSSSRPVLNCVLYCVYCGLRHVVLCYLMRVTFLAITPNYCLRNWKICPILSLSPARAHSLYEFDLLGSFSTRSFVSVSFGLPSIGNCSSDCISDPTIFSQWPSYPHIHITNHKQAGNQFETNKTNENTVILPMETNKRWM